MKTIKSLSKIILGVTLLVIAGLAFVVFAGETADNVPFTWDILLWKALAAVVIYGTYRIARFVFPEMFESDSSWENERI